MNDIYEIRGKRFYDKLRKKVSKYCGKYSDIVLIAPDFFILLLRLIKDKRIPAKYIGYLAGAIAYFMTPFDLIPEILLGPIGYTDDIIIAVIVLDKIINKVGEDVVVENWSGRGNILALIQNILTIFNFFISNNIKMLKKKIGLD